MKEEEGCREGKARVGVLSENTHPDLSGQKEPLQLSKQATSGPSGLVAIVKPRQPEQLWVLLQLN